MTISAGATDEAVKDAKGGEASAKPGEAQQPQGGPKPPETKPEPQGAKAQEGSPGSPGAREARSIDDDDEPDEKELYQLSGAALKKRLGRYSKSQLKEHFGTTNVDEIKGKLKKLESLEAKAEEERRKKLAEEERLKEDIAKANARAEAAEAKARDAEDRQVVATQERRMTSLAGKHIDEDLVDDAIERFARHVRGLSPKEASKLDDDAIAKWFADLASSKPKFAKGGAPAAKEEPAKREPKKEPITNGASGGKPAPKKDHEAGFDPARVNPKHPQAYSQAELRKFRDAGAW